MMTAPNVIQTITPNSSGSLAPSRSRRAPRASHTLPTLTTTMHGDGDRDKMETGPSLLEFVLRLHGDFRRSLEPLRVTPLQAGMLLFLRRHTEARVTDAASALRLRVATLSEVVGALVRKRWVRKRRSVTDTRVVYLSLNRQGKTLARHIEQRVRNIELTLTEHDKGALGMTRRDSSP